MDPIAWLTEMSQDTMPDREGFQARPLYIALNVLVPLIYGAIVAGIVNLAQRLRPAPAAGSDD